MSLVDKLTERLKTVPRSTGGKPCMTCSALPPDVLAWLTDVLTARTVSRAQLVALLAEEGLHVTLSSLDKHARSPRCAATVATRTACLKPQSRRAR